MPSKRNRRHRRRPKHIICSNIAQSSLDDQTENKDQEHDQTILDVSTDDKKINIVERIQTLLETEVGNKIEHILEALVKICQCKEKRDLRHDLLENCMRNLQECDSKEVVDVYRQTRCLFKSDKLKKLLVGNDDIHVKHYISLGEGCFGVVKLGYLKDPKGDYKEVAVKMLHPYTETNLVNEAEIMSQLDHINVVKILGFQPGVDPKLVMEYYSHGNLTEYVPMYSLSTKQLLQFVLEIATGMEYITNKKYVHRDLSCKNVFVSDELHCKIGDFGLCQYVGDSDGVYEIEHDSYIGNIVPPELRSGGVNRKFSWKTDVWSMGVLIWQLFCLTSEFANMLCAPVLRQFISRTDRKLPQVRRCPKPLHKYITTDVMKIDPNKRPTFTMIKNRISKML